MKTTNGTKSVRALLALAALCAFSPASALAAPGDLDPSFATSGIDAGDPTDVAVRPDGKIVIAAGLGSLVLVRLEADGTPDATLGGDGTVANTLTPKGGLGWRLALQDDGRIVVAGEGARGRGSRERRLRAGPARSRRGDRSGLR